jgi:hypothetical protein
MGTNCDPSHCRGLLPSQIKGYAMKRNRLIERNP